MGNCCSRSDDLYGRTISSNRQISRRPLVLPSDEVHFVPSINSRNGWSVSDVYEFRESDCIGRGGFGSVFRARRINQHGRAVGPEAMVEATVAIKLTKPELNTNPVTHNVIEEEYHEVRVLTKLLSAASPNVLSLCEYYWTGKSLYIVTEFLGMELSHWIRTQERIPEATIRRAANVLLRAVAHLHEHGVVHRDLKMQNVLFKRDGDVNSLKIIDFGLARELLPGKSLNNFAGTYGYIAPEVYMRMPYRFEVDMFAFGVILFTMLSGGMRPFPSGIANQSELRVATLRLEYNVNQHAWAGITSPATALVRKLLIGKSERLTAHEALQERWFSSMEDSIIEVDQGPSSVPPDAFEMTMAPATESLPEYRYMLEKELRLPLETLISEQVFSGRFVHRPNQHRMIMVEDVAPVGARVLPAYVAEIGRYTEWTCRSLFIKLVSVVEQFHRARVAHRYLNLTNIIVTQSGAVLIKSVKHARYCSPTVNLTGHFGRRYCHFAYTGPEIDSEFAHDERVDLWSLGAILYTLLTGLAPFRGTGEELIRAKKRGDVAFDEHFIASPQSQRLVRDLMQPDPNMRLSLNEIWEHEWILENDSILGHRELFLPQIHMQAWVAEQ